MWRATAFLASLLGALLGVHLSFAQLTATGIGGGFGGVASYQGPGDIVSGAIFWVGLRCYSNAYAGNVADVVDAATGNTTGTRLQCSSGTVSALVSGSACTFVTGNVCSTLATTCAVACNVLTLYDQSGNGNNVTNGTLANQPGLSPTGLGSLPTTNWVGGDLLTPVSGTINQAQPFVISAVAERTGSFTTEQDWLVTLTSTVSSGFLNSANSVFIFAGSVASATAADSTYHAVQLTANGASSEVYVDGSGTSGNAGTNAATGPPRITNATSPMAQHIQEVGVWPGTFTSGQKSSMNSNQHSYWGF